MSAKNTRSSALAIADGDLVYEEREVILPDIP